MVLDFCGNLPRVTASRFVPFRIDSTIVMQGEGSVQTRLANAEPQLTVAVHFQLHCKVTTF